MNDDRTLQLERDNARLAGALRRVLEEVFQEETPGRYSVPVEFDGGDGIVCIIGGLPYDSCELIEQAFRDLEEAESDGDSNV